MDRLRTFGLMTAVCGALATGCSDEETSRRDILAMAGSSGNAGTGGAGGGTGGTGGGTGGTGGTNPAVTGECAGCAVLNVPIPATGSRQAQFLFRPTMPIDMSDTVLTWSVRVLPSSDVPADQAYIAVFAQNGEPLNYAGSYGDQLLLTPANGFDPADDDAWVEVVHDLTGNAPPPPPPPPADAGAGDAGVAGDASAPPPGTGVPDATFDNTQVFQYGLYVGALDTYTGTGTVRVAVDALDYSAGEGLTDVSFSADLEAFQLDPYELPPGTTLTHFPL